MIALLNLSALGFSFVDLGWPISRIPDLGWPISGILDLGWPILGILDLGLAHFRNSQFWLAHFGIPRFGAGQLQKAYKKMPFFWYVIHAYDPVLGF